MEQASSPRSALDARLVVKAESGAQVRVDGLCSGESRPIIYRMSKLNVQQIRSLARSIISASPGGIRYSVLVEKICQESPETPKNTVHGSVWNLDSLFPNEIAKPSRGLFTPAAKPGSDDTVEVGSTEQIAETGIKVKESDFYEPFAQWLKNDLDEVTEVASLGGAGLKSGNARNFVQIGH